MALVVFLRGVNVGGHKTFRPSLLATALSRFDVVNVGAAGTFIVRKPGSVAPFRAALARLLPFETHIVTCDARDLVRLAEDHPFASEPVAPDVVRFVTILARAARVPPPVPLAFPSERDWLLRVIAVRKQFVLGVYRRHMKAIGYLGKIDALFGAPATTRNWNTIETICRLLAPRDGTRRD